jgi:hypothetical protein
LGQWGNGACDTTRYDYDRVGNRLYDWPIAYTTQYFYNGNGPNQLSQTQSMDLMANQTTRDYSYNGDGAVTGITTKYSSQALVD